MQFSHKTNRLARKPKLATQI